MSNVQKREKGKKKNKEEGKGGRNEQEKKSKGCEFWIIANLASKHFFKNKNL